MNFKSIKRVPSDLSNIVLSSLQRRTPTVIRKYHPIPKIRSFYTRKVKFCSQEYINQINMIIRSFPHIDDIHPFYTDLFNVLYNKSEYKIALGHLNNTKKNVQNIANEYVRLIKYGTSLFGCKQLKVAGVGKMTKYVNKLKPTLLYLEEIRQHISRLPEIYPEKRTLIIIGLPNTGKSSFMNIVSKANVDVQGYAGTTRSLFVGHFEKNNLDWQILDTPGILGIKECPSDKNENINILEDLNSIEMQSITALAHINATILFFLDLSESCGFSIEQQISLYNVIHNLVEKEFIIVLCKSDLRDESQIDSHVQSFLENKKHYSCTIHASATIHTVLSHACESHLNNSVNEKIHKEIPVTKINVKEPAKLKEKCDNNLRIDEIETEKEKEKRLDGYVFDERKNYLIEDKYDTIPEIFNGMNVIDYLNINEEDCDAIIQESNKILNTEYDIFEDSIKKEIDKEVKKVNILRKERKRSRVSDWKRNNISRNKSKIKDQIKKIKGERDFMEKQKKKEFNEKPRHFYR